MNTHRPIQPVSYFLRAFTLTAAIVALCACNSYSVPNEADLIRVRDRGAKFPKLPHLEPVFLEEGGSTSESLIRERNVFFAEARQNLVKRADATGDIDGYLVLATTNIRDVKFITDKFSTGLKLQVLDRYGNEIKQYNETTKGSKFGAGPNDIGSLQIYKKTLEKIISDLSRDVPDITRMLDAQQGTPQQAEYIANLVVGNQINSQQIAEIGRINKANVEAIQAARRQELAQGLAAIAGAVQTVASNIQQQQEYKRQQEQYRQQQAQYQQQQAQQQQAAQSQAREAEYWRKRAAKENKDALKQDVNVAVRTATGDVTAGDIAVRNGENRLAATTNNLAATMQRNADRSAAAASAPPPSAPPPQPPSSAPVVTTPAPVIVNAAPVVLQQAPQYSAPAAVPDYTQQISRNSQPTPSASSQDMEGGSAAAARLFRMGLNASVGGNAAETFNPSDTGAELAREHYYRDANPANAKQQSQAFVFFTSAAKQGNRPAMYHLALMYKYGRGTPQNDAEAAKWLAAAAAASYEPAIQLQNKTTP